MLKSLFVDQLGNHAFQTLRPIEGEPSQDKKFVLRVHNPHSSLLKLPLPRLLAGENVVPPSDNDHLSDHYALEDGTYTIEWANDRKTTVIVEQVNVEVLRVHLRDHYGVDVTFGSHSDMSALPPPNKISFVDGSSKE